MFVVEIRNELLFYFNFFISTTTKYNFFLLLLINGYLKAKLNSILFNIICGMMTVLNMKLKTNKYILIIDICAIFQCSLPEVISLNTANGIKKYY